MTEYLFNNLKQYLWFITPGPLGKGMTIKEAAAEVLVHPQTITDTLRKFREDMPEAYERWKSIMDCARQHREAFKWMVIRPYPKGYYGPISNRNHNVGSDLYAMDEYIGEQIKEKF